MGLKSDNMYVYGRIYFSDLKDLVEQWSYSVDDILDMPKDFKLEVKICTSTPLYEFTTEKIVENIPENDIPEEGFLEYMEGIRDAVEATLDLESLNKEVPKIWVATDQFKVFTKDDFLQTLN